MNDQDHPGDADDADDVEIVDAEIVEVEVIDDDGRPPPSELEVLEDGVLLMSGEEARRRTDALRDNIVDNFKEMIELRRRQVWRSLNYTTWDDYWRAEFAGYKAPRLNTSERRELVGTLGETTEMPGAVLAQMFSVAESTISRDLEALQRGRTANDGQVPAQERRIVTSTGATQKAARRGRAKPPTIREASYEEAFSAAAYEVATAAGRLHVLFEDPRFAQYLSALKANHGKELGTAFTQLADVMERLD